MAQRTSVTIEQEPSLRDDPESHPRNRRSRSGTLSLEAKDPKAIVYDLDYHNLTTTRLSNLKGRSCVCLPYTPQHHLLRGHYYYAELEEQSEVFPVYLPAWRNRVDVYLDRENNEQGFLASIQLRQLGLIANWQRHLGHNYKDLYIRRRRQA